MILGAVVPFSKSAATGGGSGAPYALASGVEVPEGATRVAVAIVGWSNGNDLTTAPTFGGVALTLAGSVNGYVGQLPRGRVWEREIAEIEWGQSLDLIVDDSAYNYSQFGHLLFHDGGDARAASTFRTSDDGTDVPLTASAAELGDAVIVIGATRNTAAALITYAGGPDEDEVDSAYPGSGEQFSLHRSVVAQATAAQEIGGTGVLSPAGGGTVDWRAFLAVPLARPASTLISATISASSDLVAVVAMAIGATVSAGVTLTATLSTESGGGLTPPSASGRSVIARLADHEVRIWRAVTTKSAMGADRRTYEVVGEELAKVNRDTSPTGDAGPGLATIGRRRLYLPPDADARHRDVIELVTGPDAPQTWEVDENGTRPRGHHLQLDCIEWRGKLPEVES